MSRTERTFRVEAAGHQVFTRAFGPEQGRAFVLVHGLAVSGRYMLPLARELGEVERVLLPDLPGFGKSPRPRKAFDIQQLGAVLLAWAEALGLARGLYIGNSMGCQTVTEAAIAAPHRMSGVVFLGPTMDPTAWGTPGQIGRLLRDQFVEPPTLVPIQVMDYLIAGPIRVAQTYFHALRHRMLERVGQVQVPGLVIRGGRDPIVSRRWAQAIAEKMPLGRPLVEIPRAAHALNYNSPRQVMELVRKFADEIGA